ncbi:IQ motif, EF-hand binding site [Sesbania bispinosa]|nr:IQ motif, EF-hand binding site [Sesbania bispinosa]
MATVEEPHVESSYSQHDIGNVGANATHHVAIEIDTASSLEVGADHGNDSELQSEFNNHCQELPLLRKRHFVTTVPNEMYLRNTLASYRTTANAATHIQAEFREHTLKEIKEFQFSNPEAEARKIVAAMKIQHVFRNYKTRKMTEAATRIQRNFRKWISKESTYTRQQAIKIQAAFRGFHVRKQYSIILWSMGVIDKTILRCRFKRRGFRALYVNLVQEMEGKRQENKVEDKSKPKNLL